MIRTVFLSLLVSCVTPPLAAQAIASASPFDRLLKPGDTVKVAATWLRYSTTGPVTRVSSDTIRLRARLSGQREVVETMFLRESLERIEVLTGRRRSPARAVAGTLLGFVGGAAIGGFLGFHTAPPAECEATDTCQGFRGMGQGMRAFFFSFAGGGLGALAGSIAGARHQPVWRRVFP